MSKTVVILSITTAMFAASTAYLAHELYERDSGEVSVAGVPASDAARSGTHPGPDATGAGAKGDISTANVPAHNSLPEKSAGARPAGVAAAESKGQEGQGDAVNAFA